MIGLRSQFGLSLFLVAIVVTTAVLAAAVAAARAPAGGGAKRTAAARVLAAGALTVTLVATALPQRLGIATDGDLVFRLGAGGLGNWRILFEDPTSLASVELVGNVLLYTAICFTLTLGWYAHRWLVLPVCVALSVLIETVQYLVLGRVAALDDVVLNGAGAAVGHLVAMAVMRSRAIAGEGAAGDRAVVIPDRSRPDR